MPRIAAVLGVFAVIAICIVVNTKRYPAVWEMVGQSAWFTRDTESSQNDSSSQDTQLAENDASQESSYGSRLDQEPLAPRTPPSLRPEVSSNSNSVAGSWSGYAGYDSGDSDYSNYGSYGDSDETEDAKTPAYKGLNPGPIKVRDSAEESIASNDYSSDYSSEYSNDYSDDRSNDDSGDYSGEYGNDYGGDDSYGTSQDTESMAEATTPPGESDGKWPAEMSPKMKYAAKPPLLESTQQWSGERPVVPVVRPDDMNKTDDSNPDSGDSSRYESYQPSSDTSLEDDKTEAVVRHLPEVDPERRPIRLSVEGKYSQQPIPVYPSTED